MLRRLLPFLAGLAVSVFVRGLHALQPGSPCESYQRSTRMNPNDLAAAAELGRCTVRDEEMVAPGGDSTRLAFRTSWNPALRALRHAVQVDPTSAPAYRPLFRMLLADMRDGCSRAAGTCRHVAAIVRDGDSVITVPRLVPELSDEPYEPTYQETKATQHVSLAEARALATRWAAASPNDRRPYEYLGRALLRLGDGEAAVDAFERAATLGTPESRRALFWERIEALIKANRGAAARHVLDEAASDTGRDTTRLRADAIAALNGLVGRYRPAPVDSVRWPAARARIDSMVRSAPSPPPRPREPTIEELIAAKDTAGARRRLAQIDSSYALPPGTRRFPRVDRRQVQLARYHLALDDTAGAEARLRTIDGPLHERHFQHSISSAYERSRPLWLGEAWLLIGDVAARRGRPDEAARMYRRVVGLWADGDADIQPVVDSARSRLRTLQPR